MNAFELKVHRANTAAFIAERPSPLQLQRVIRVSTPGGGYRNQDSEDPAAQVFRIIELGQNVSVPVLRTQDGTQRQVEFELLGVWDADVKVDDSWVASNGREWVIGNVVRSNGYETRALVVERGR